MDRFRQGDSDQIFEPLGRCRAFTWHGNLKDKDYSSTDQSTKPELSTVVESLNTDDQKNEVLNLKKPSTRRNAWGCMSYADLITKAIESVPEKRLTLSQIYAWMIQNVPYFKDKGESNSSAGWKNSVRHNLSLHRKFVRVQNEGTGKSSWWIVNNEVKSCKSPRRRAASMDNRSYEKKKCQTMAKQNLQERNPPAASHTKSDVPAVPEVQRLDSFATAFSPIDLRSNGKDAVLKSGLLSPMGLAAELPLGGDEAMKQSLPLYWNRCHNVNPSYLHPEGLAETVSESLAELYTPDMNSSYEPSFLPDRQLTVLQNISNDKYISDSSYLSFQDLPSPPPYAGHPPTAPEDLFPQVNAKDLLQLSTSSDHQVDALSGAQYMARTGVSMHQGLPDDVSVMHKYYAERNEGGGGGFAGEPCGRNSVLRQMLMQAQQQGGPLSGYVDHPLESVVKSEPAEIDAFSYRDANPFPSETMLPAGSVLSAANDGQSSILDYRKSSEYVVIKPETDVETLEGDRQREVWNFNSTSSDADGQSDN